MAIFTNKTQIRVRYAETDKMGYCYHANYIAYFEVGRAECLRDLGMSYREMEDTGILMPVTEMSVKYLKPAFYDEVLSVRTTITQVPSVRMFFDYEITNDKMELITQASSTLVFMNAQTRRPMPPPKRLLKALDPVAV